MNNHYVRIVILILALYLFIVGIKTMSGGFKDMGSGFSEGLVTTASNPLVGLFIGILATSVIQSSSATTSMVVTMVAAGVSGAEKPVEALPKFVSMAIPMIIGANIGTSVTNMIVSFGHVTRGTEFERAFAGAVVHDFFNVIAASILFPLELLKNSYQVLGVVSKSFFFFLFSVIQLFFNHHVLVILFWVLARTSCSLIDDFISILLFS